MSLRDCHGNIKTNIIHKKTSYLKAVTVGCILGMCSAWSGHPGAERKDVTVSGRRGTDYSAMQITWFQLWEVLKFQSGKKT